MKTLTITEARKNLGRWLDGAARGEDIGIICGAQIIALRRVEVESTDYAQREYGVTPEQVARAAEAVDKHYWRLKRTDKMRSNSTREYIHGLRGSLKGKTSVLEAMLRERKRERAL